MNTWLMGDNSVNIQSSNWFMGTAYLYTKFYLNAGGQPQSRTVSYQTCNKNGTVPVVPLFSTNSLGNNVTKHVFATSFVYNLGQAASISLLWNCKGW